jgi:hypothetical protein
MVDGLHLRNVPHIVALHFTPRLRIIVFLAVDPELDAPMLYLTLISHSDRDPFKLVTGELKVLTNYSKQVNVLPGARGWHIVKQELAVQVLNIKRFTVVMDNSIGLIKKIPNLLDVVFVVLIAKMNFLFTKPFRGPTKDSAWLNNLLGRNISLNKGERVYLI